MLHTKTIIGTVDFSQTHWETAEQYLERYTLVTRNAMRAHTIWVSIDEVVIVIKNTFTNVTPIVKQCMPLHNITFHILLTMWDQR